MVQHERGTSKIDSEEEMNVPAKSCENPVKYFLWNQIQLQKNKTKKQQMLNNKMEKTTPETSKT